MTLLIIGIGASAGGLEAFKSFFASTPPNTGMAFVLVQHLSPDHKSMLSDLLGKTTEMDVIEAADGVVVKPNSVFVIPPDATMTIAGGRLKVVKPAPPRDRRRPIDTFLQSLAEDQGENAVCIILSGTGSDGTLGLTAIRESGGFTLAQAEYDHHALPGMPQSAASSGQVDEVLPVEAMPARLASYQAHLLAVAQNKDSDGVRTDAVSHMATIMGALRARSGHDFTNYKEKTLLRRLQRRMQLLQVDTPSAYIEFFRKQPEELDLLFRELLIGVTQFFRDPDAFEALNDDVLKALLSGKGAHESVRVWVAGCATGEEAFTLAILLREAMDARRPKPKVQIFATDIDDRAITAARLGRYRGPVAGVSPERIERWFKQEGDDFCVVPEIREMCVFSVHSVIKDPPFSKLDLISCRNLLIYIDPPMQDRVLHSFHYALKPGGRLFLGSSESVTRTTKLFATRDKKQRIFERRDVEGALLSSPPSRSAGIPIPVPHSMPYPSPSDRIEKGARRAMEKHNPPHVVIDKSHQIVRFSGAALGRYFEPGTGTPSFALFDILRKPLRAAVRQLLQDAQSTKNTVRNNNIPLRIEGSPHLIMLIAEPMDEEGEFIVLAFQDGGTDLPEDSTPSADVVVSDAMRAIEQDLLTTKTQLQATIDELETANEEMKSSNEEYQSVNEELQSSNEELETAKEEMQSVNEELQTINAEMVSKNEQLTRLNSDIKNLLESTEIATLFLDENLRIKSFTRGIGDLFSVRDSDLGRPITDISSLLNYAELQQDVKTVLRKLVMTERRVKLSDGSMSFEMRVRPYRTVDNVIDGVVCTFIDITAREAADAALRASEQQFHLMAESMPQLAWIMDGDGYIFWYNRRWFDYTNTTLEDMKGWGWQSVHHPDEIERVVTNLKHCIATGQIWEDTFPLRGADGNYRTFLSRAEPFRDESNKIVRWFGTNTDIEDQKRGEELRELLLREMDHRVKNLFAIVGGVVMISARNAATPQEMAATVQGRLGALANAHKLIRQDKLDAKRETTLAILAGSILSPHTDTAMIEGPEVVLADDAVTSLALVLHELATNAAKYGSLSVSDGRVAINWTVNDEKLMLKWEERGGPVVIGPPERQGFGSMLARNTVCGQLDGEFDFQWNSLGLAVFVTIPFDRLLPRSLMAT